MVGSKSAVVTPVFTEATKPKWYTLKCDHCEKNVKAVAQMGQELGYDNATAMVCLSCLRKAVKKLEKLD